MSTILEDLDDDESRFYRLTPQLTLSSSSDTPNSNTDISSSSESEDHILDSYVTATGEILYENFDLEEYTSQNSLGSPVRLVWTGKRALYSRDYWSRLVLILGS